MIITLIEYQEQKQSLSSIKMKNENEIEIITRVDSETFKSPMVMQQRINNTSKDFEAAKLLFTKIIEQKNQLIDLILNSLDKKI